MESPKFSVGSAVFVKMRGYPAWPAKVEGIADETPNKIKYHIFFYGTNQIAVSKEEEMCSYLKYRELLGKPKKAKGFNKAILQMDSELGLVPNTSCVKKSELSANCENETDVEMKESRPSDQSDIALDVNHSKETLNETETSISHPLDTTDALQADVLSTLKLEFNLDKVHYGIQNSLNLKKADPEACLQYLNQLAHMKLNKLILKKHPEVVYSLLKVQTYVGNTNNWDMADNDITLFKSKAEKIQKESKVICDNIKALFQVPKGVAFIDYFESELNTFKNLTKDMPLDDFFRLTKDPTEV